MAGDLIYASRIMRLPLLDAAGAVIGRLDDIVIIPGADAIKISTQIQPWPFSGSSSALIFGSGFQ